MTSTTSPRTRVRTALATLLLLLAAACSPTPQTGEPAGQRPTPVPVPGQQDAAPQGGVDTPAATAPPAGAAPSAPAQDPGPSGPADGVADAGSSPGAPAATAPAGAARPAPAPPPSVGDPLGALCRPYLQPTVPSLLIEVDAQAGAELPQGVLDHLVTTLAAVLDKPGGIAVDTSGVIPGGGQPWTLESVRQTAAASRTADSTPDQLVLHVLSLRGQAAEDSEISQSIGVAFAAGEFAVFPERIDGLAALIGGTEAVLRSVAVHEAGHLLCLVNLGYTSDIPHEDPQHPGHSADRGSVMFHAIETTAIGQLFSGPPPDAFTANDLADLEGLRTGRY